MADEPQPRPKNGNSSGLGTAIRRSVVGVYRAETASELETTVDVLALVPLVFAVFGIVTVAMLATGSVYVILSSAIGATGGTAALLLVAWFVAFVAICGVGIRWLVIHFWRPINRARRRIDQRIDERVGGIRQEPAANAASGPARESLSELDARLASPDSADPADPTN